VRRSTFELLAVTACSASFEVRNRRAVRVERRAPRAARDIEVTDVDCREIAHSAGFVFGLPYLCKVRGVSLEAMSIEGAQGPAVLRENVE